MTPACFMCGSTASRAMKRCWISLVPSKMRLMRMSRRIRSTGQGLLAARAQRLGRLVTAAAADLDELVDDLPA
jgi:hypothetical protein